MSGAVWISWSGRAGAATLGTAAVAVAISGPVHASGPEPCLPAAIGSATVAGIAGPAALRLDDGRTVRLAGIAAAFAPLDEIAAAHAVENGASDPGPDVPREMDDRRPPAAPGEPDAGRAFDADAARALERLAEGARVSIRPVGSGPDRHGRIVAHVTREPDGLWLSAALVGEGLARVVPRTGDAACTRALQGVEAEARRAGRGLWAEAAFAPRRADDPALAAAAGRYALIEGRVLSTGHAGTRYYLNFGRSFRSDFTAVIDDKNVGRFRAAGLEPQTLAGRTVRLRGWVTARDGGMMVLTLPEEIEWVE